MDVVTFIDLMNEAGPICCILNEGQTLRPTPTRGCIQIHVRADAVASVPSARPVGNWVSEVLTAPVVLHVLQTTINQCSSRQP